MSNDGYHLNKELLTGKLKLHLTSLFVTTVAKAIRTVAACVVLFPGAYPENKLYTTGGSRQCYCLHQLSGNDGTLLNNGKSLQKYYQSQARTQVERVLCKGVVCS